jgi:phosphoglycolate phosphatase-like HAD superfamily hydrolase
MLQIAGRRLDPRLIVFDKDGTLIAYDPVWHAWWAYWRAHLQAALQDAALDDTVFWRELQPALGYGPGPDDWDPLGPLTLASTEELTLLIAGALYRYAGCGWGQAQTMARAAENAARAAMAGQDLLQPIGAVAGTLRRLHDAGVLLAVATTDNRRSAEHDLGRLGVPHLLATLVCARRRPGAQAGVGHGARRTPGGGRGSRAGGHGWAIPLPIWNGDGGGLWLGRGGGVWPPFAR